MLAQARTGSNIADRMGGADARICDRNGFCRIESSIR
jgi:hypothetical protein